MGDVVSCNGNIVSGPSAATDSVFPGGVTTIPYQLTPEQKIANVTAGSVMQINSPSSFVAIPGVGASGPVTQGTFLYIRANSPMSIRTTCARPSSSDVLAVEVVRMKIVEFDDSNYLKLLEVQGSGTIEYFVSGTQ